MSGGSIDEAMEAVGMTLCGVPRNSDMRALGSILFPQGPHVQPFLQLGCHGTEMLWEVPADSCTYSEPFVDSLDVNIDLPGFETAGELALWMYGQGFPELLADISTHGELVMGDQPNETVFDLPPDAQARWDNFQNACQRRIQSPKNKVSIGENVYLYELYPRAREILADPATDPDVLALFLRRGVREDLMKAAAGNPSCRLDDRIIAALTFPDVFKPGWLHADNNGSD